MATLLLVRCACSEDPANPADGVDASESTLDAGSGGPDAAMPSGDSGLLVACTVPAIPPTTSAPECGELPKGACETGTDCPSGLCLHLTTGPRCTDACASEAQCPKGERCLVDERSAEGYCAPRGTR